MILLYIPISRDTSKSIQEALFRMGFRWTASGKTVQPYFTGFIVLSSKGTFSHTSSAVNSAPYFKITPELLLKIQEENNNGK